MFSFIETLLHLFLYIFNSIRLRIKLFFSPFPVTNSQNMKLVLGLGNPTKLYDNTRHNIGKMFVDHLVKKYSLAPHKTTQKFQSYLFGNTIIAKSQVYMNLSVQAFDAIQKQYPGVVIKNTIVALDDLDHKLGNARIKTTGSAQGHRGALSMMNKLKTKDVIRLQLGIDRPQSRDPQVVADFVLRKMKNNERQLVNQGFKKAIQLLQKQKYLVYLK